MGCLSNIYMYEFLHTNIAEMSFVTKTSSLYDNWAFRYNEYNYTDNLFHFFFLFHSSKIQQATWYVILEVKKDHVLDILHKMRHSFISSRFYGQHIAECVPWKLLLKTYKLLFKLHSVKKYSPFLTLANLNDKPVNKDLTLFAVI